MEFAPITDEQAAIDALTFVNVALGGTAVGNIKMSGHLTEISAKMLLVELKRAGFKMMRSIG